MCNFLNVILYDGGLYMIEFVEFQIMVFCLVLLYFVCDLLRIINGEIVKVFEILFDIVI